MILQEDLGDRAAGKPRHRGREPQALRLDIKGLGYAAIQRALAGDHADTRLTWVGTVAACRGGAMGELAAP
jgi:hypothetical protein